MNKEAHVGPEWAIAVGGGRLTECQLPQSSCSKADRLVPATTGQLGAHFRHLHHAIGFPKADNALPVLADQAGGDADLGGAGEYLYPLGLAVR